jgi:tetratricopeptide (TPR) repeat protein
MRSRTCRLSSLAVVATALLAATALAQPRGPSRAEMERAKKTYSEGAAAYQLGRFEEAVKKFEEAYRVTNFATMLFDIAQCYRRMYEGGRDLGHLTKALDIYRAFLRQAPANASKRPAAEELVPRLERTLAEETRRQREALLARAVGREGLAIAERLINDGALKEAALAIDRVLQSRENPRDVILDALAKKGLVAGRLGQEAAATEAFKRALALDPGLVLPFGGGAATTAACDAARRFWQGKRPLTVTHVAPGSLQRNRAARLAVTIESDPLAMVTQMAVHYRLAGQGAYSSASAPVRAAAVEIPSTFLAGLDEGTRVEYYIVALDAAEGELTSMASAKEPFVVAIAGGGGPGGGPGSRPAVTPWYRKWWVWAIAGSVAVGAGLGAYFGTRASPFNPPPVHIPTQ